MKWRYRKVEVQDADVVEVPVGSKGVQIRPLAGKRVSFVEWMEPIEEEEE